ncbi:hypothetical protein [Achromobacter sp. UBA2119]|uniref:hypothetical protein n=1 Tax=Achromobacter sp. UBA2119 TaxID=1945911 RepID=UPI00257FC175|nr:hypothetical protein [Achromobacter sp. UBA2119]
MAAQQVPTKKRDRDNRHGLFATTTATSTANFNCKLQLQTSTANFNCELQLQLQTATANCNCELQLRTALQLLTSTSTADFNDYCYCYFNRRCTPKIPASGHDATRGRPGYSKQLTG